MNSKAQVSIEYLVILAVLVIMTLIVTAISVNFTSARNGLMEQARLLAQGAGEMI